MTTILARTYSCKSIVVPPVGFRLIRIWLLQVVLILILMNIGAELLTASKFILSHVALDMPTGLQASTVCTVRQQYFGMNVDMSQIVPESPKYITNDQGQDLLSVLSGLGANMVRLTNSKVAFPDNLLYTKDQWLAVLDRLQSLHIRAIILIETPAVYQPLLNDSYFSLLNTYINDYGLANHPAVYAIDIKNEPYFSKDNLLLLAKARAIVKAQNPEMLVTIGGWRTSQSKIAGQSPQTDLWARPQDIALVKDIIDVVSVHLYGFDDFYRPVTYSADFTGAYLLALRLFTQKPIIIGEFGSGNGDAVTDGQTLGSRELQANTYRGVFYAVHKWCDNGVVGAIGYTTYAVDSSSQGWNIVGPNANELFGATDAFRWQADSANISKPFVPVANIPKAYLLNEKNNRTFLAVHRGDRIALILSGGTAVALTTKLNGLVLKQDMTLNADVGRNTAILLAVSAGKSTLAVTDNSKLLYSYTVVVQ